MHAAFTLRGTSVLWTDSPAWQRSHAHGRTLPARGQMCRIQLVLNSIFSHILQLPDCKPSSELQRRDTGTSAVQMQGDVSSQQFPYGPHLSGCLCSLRVEHSHWEVTWGDSEPHCVQNGLLLSSNLPCSALDCILIRMKGVGSRAGRCKPGTPATWEAGAGD